jgi:hypothetical protein
MWRGEHFAVIEDPRRGPVTHNLVEMLVIACCALFSEVETFVDMAEWARYKEAWLRGFLRLEHGLPSHDTLNRVFRLLDPKSFEAVFRAWVADTLPAFGGQIAIDGKSLRGARRANPIHLVSAFATEMGLVLAQEGVPDKGGETAAIPDLLRALEVRGCLVSLDALGCQREIAEVSARRTICSRSKATSQACARHSKMPLPTVLKRRPMNRLSKATAGAALNWPRSSPTLGRSTPPSGRTVRVWAGCCRSAAKPASQDRSRRATTSVRPSSTLTHWPLRCDGIGPSKTICTGVWTSLWARMPARCVGTTHRRTCPSCVG